MYPENEVMQIFTGDGKTFVNIFYSWINDKSFKYIFQVISIILETIFTHVFSAVSEERFISV